MPRKKVRSKVTKATVATYKSEKATPQKHSKSYQQHVSRRKQSNPKKRVPYSELLILGKRFKVNNNIQEQILHLQQTNLLIPILPFAKLVREICLEYGPSDLRIQSNALRALQVATEAFLIDFFRKCYLCALHAKRVTLLIRDCLLAKEILQDQL